jgi:preprotein translocase SecE subunit
MAVNKKGESGSEGSTNKEDSKTAETTKLTPSESKNMPLTKADSEASADDKTKSSSSSAKSGNKSAEAKFMPEDAAKKKKERQDKPAFGQQFIDFLQYLREVQIEFRKISWPESGEVIRATYSVLFLVAVITLLVLGFDFALGKVFFGPLEHWARMLGGGIGRG